MFNSSSFVPSDLQERLENFTNSGVDGINITMFREQIDQQILSFNVSEQIIELEMLRDNLTNAVINNYCCNYCIYNVIIYTECRCFS